MKKSLRSRPELLEEISLLEQRIEELERSLAKREVTEESEETFRSLINATNETLILIDTEGIILVANETVARRLGQSVQGLIGTSQYDYFPPDVARSRKEYCDRVISTGKPVSFEDERAGRSFEIIAYPVFDAAGTVSKIAIFAQDITDRKQAEKALRESEQRFFIASSTTSDIIWDWNIMDNKVVWFGDIDTMLGYDTGDFPGTFEDWEKTIHPDDHDRVMAGLYQYLREQVPFDEEYRIVRRDGSVRYWTDRGVVLYDEKGNAARMIGACTDVTSRKKAEEALRKAHDELEIRVQERTIQLTEAYTSLQCEMKERKRAEEQLYQSRKLEAVGTLAGGIAHDFNNVLAAIIGFGEIVQEDLPPESQDARYLQKVLIAAYRGRDLVQQILAFSRKSALTRKPLSLYPIVKETVQLLRAAVPSTIEIQLKIKTEKDTIFATASEFQQVLMNLATNASFAMKEKGGVLEISVANVDLGSDPIMLDIDIEPGEYVQLAVSDTGSGMTPEVIKRVFEPFFTTKGVGEGTGMGLAVVYGIVKSLGGILSVESEPGSGSTFRVYLPVVRPDERPEIGEAQRMPKGGAERILFIDDEEFLVEWGKVTLENLGYTTVAMTDSAEALAIFTADPSRFDLVILDQTMPKLTGLQFARKILAMRNDIPIILYTGYSDNVSPEKAQDAGIKEFLMKPLGKKKLAEVVRRTLDTTRSASSIPGPSHPQ